MSDAPKRPARDRLLAAVAELTYAGGIEATGVDAIARRAGVTKRTLYQHFRSKDELVAASLAWRDGPAIDSLRAYALRRAAADGAPPILALFDVLHDSLEGIAARGCAFLNAALELEDADHPVVRSALHHLEARRRLVAELLSASGVDTDPATADPAAADLVDQLVLLVDGSFAVAASRRDPSAARHARRAAEHLLAHRREHNQPPQEA